MKTLKITSLIILIGLFSSCEKDIFFPTYEDTGPICTIEISDTDLLYIKDKIKEEPFRDSKLNRGINLTRHHCFITPQVIEIMDLYAFNDDRLTIAKHLYHHTIDKHRYYDVVDQLAFKSDRDELTRYIESQ